MAGAAVIIGGGIGGLAAAVALRRVGWQVRVLERAEHLGEIGAGIVLMSNGLRCLDTLGLGEKVRDRGRPEAPTGVRTASGRWLSRLDDTRLEGHLGTAAIVVHRAELHDVLRGALPAETVITGATPSAITAIDDDNQKVVEVRYRHAGETTTARADLVVGADGVHSWVRAQRWPDSPGPVYSGTTAWRAITHRAPSHPSNPSHTATEMSMSWGRGTEFGILPLRDGRIYWYAAANAREGGQGPAHPDELGWLRHRFRSWHSPIPELLAATAPEAVLRHDLYRLPALPSYTRDRIVLLGDAAHAMTPNLGQGGGQALEDAIVLAAATAEAAETTDPTTDLPAALARYDRQRRARTQAMSRTATAQLRIGQQLHNPIAVALRNTAITLTPARTALRAAARFGDWFPPTLPETPDRDAGVSRGQPLNRRAEPPPWRTRRGRPARPRVPRAPCPGQPCSPRAATRRRNRSRCIR